MNKVKKGRIFFWITLKYVATIVLFAALLFTTLMIGIWVCHLFTWYPDNTIYWYLKFVDEFRGEIVLVLLLTVSVLSAIYNFWRLSHNMEKVTDFIGEIYDDVESDIVLPAEFRTIYDRLTLLRFEYVTRKMSEQEANQRKNDMIMYMAHDLKTPLTSVIGYLELLKEVPDLSTEARSRYVLTAYNKSVRLEELIEEMFDIARYNFSHIILQKQKVDLSMMLEQIITEFEIKFREKQIVCDRGIENGLTYVCDVDKIERVFDNLLRNALNYSYPNTTIYVDLCKVDVKGMSSVDYPAISYEESECIRQFGSALRLIVHNRGKTIPPEMLSHIFDQFVRADGARMTRDGGSGLGLAITKEIVELHGGLVRCESKNEEITFIITLPIEE